jgi:hypothetical protein
MIYLAKYMFQDYNYYKNLRMLISLKFDMDKKLYTKLYP